MKDSNSTKIQDEKDCCRDGGECLCEKSAEELEKMMMTQGCCGGGCCQTQVVGSSE